MIEILLTLCILSLLAAVGVCIFIIRNLIIQNRIYEDWVVRFSKRAEDTYNYMKYLDEKQIFETDDEVGIAFREIRDLTEELKSKLGNDDDEEESQ